MLTKKEILTYLKNPDIRELCDRADQVRREFCGPEVFIRGIVEFSNHCMRNCQYCGLRCENRSLKRYRMTADEILQCVRELNAQKIQTVILQSGDDFGYTKAMISEIIQMIKFEMPALAITLSLGERHMDEFFAFYEKGADRYLLKHETANPELYRQLHPGQNLEHRMKILKFLKTIGYQVGTGNIVGLPGQTLEDLAEDILFYQEFQPDMIGIGPFIPQKDTPLSKHPVPDLNLVLKMIALARIGTRNAHIPSTTALNTLKPIQGHRQALRSGANIIMVNFTPAEYRKNYRIYDDRQTFTLKQAAELITKLGRKPGFERGDSLKNVKKKSSPPIEILNCNH